MPTADELLDFPALAGLDAEHRQLLADLAETVTLPPGERIFEEGQVADACWLIRTGRVTLDAGQPAGPRYVVQTLGPGDVLGWSWLVPPYRWQLGASAAEAVTAVRLDAAAMRAAAETDPAFGYPLLLGFVTALLPRLHGTRARLLDLYGNPRDR
ncbi:MAG TPA: cyclic nucleotide-binding domain-containing protein [Jatrophihabitans sp.]|jgi:CRP-like cAMP-binding protein|uniref:Crp/Fnr family transcriptional regulator n=1 Tax=Jatrophihabitans sp. TaxID=1932789 RepID=UPI002DFD6C8D|nr:cyclic nucleotide-binding domain-containing protein [Jatrophihabitans sp.]